ncbi:MAG: hypothetical protein N2234_08255 [Planctomycetota bacterium]|nr:hypothetical protein [Planctomycetota bacterium]
MRWFVVSGMLLFSLFLFAQDVIFLDGGGKLKGSIVEEDEDYVVLKTKAGETKIERSRIERIEYEAGFQEEYERRLGETKKKKNDPDAWYQLGMWCKLKGHQKEADECFKKVIELDSEHSGARNELGYYKVKDKWVTEDEYWRSQGYERWGGSWLPKEEVEKMRATPKPSPTDPKEKPSNEEKKTETGQGEPLGDPGDPSGGLARNLKERERQRNLPPEDPQERKKWIEDVKQKMGFQLVYESKHYIFFSNAPEDATKMYANMMDRVFKEYSKIFEFKGTQKRPFVVTMYGSYQEFLQKEHKPPGVGGFYDGSRISCPYGRAGNLDTQTVLLHEGTHQFQDMVFYDMLPLTQVPGAIWFIEGLATYFESGSFDPDSGAFRLNLNSNRLSVLKRAMASGRYVRIEQLLDMTQAGFGAFHYSHAYGLVYFMLNYSKDFRNKFKKYFDAFKKPNVKPKEEFIKLYGDDWEKLNKLWCQYILSVQ